MKSKPAILEHKGIRRTLHNGEWWFVVEDVVHAMTESKDPGQSIRRMKQGDPELGKGWMQIVRTLPIEMAGGIQKMHCANMEGIFRIIQSIQSSKPEPCKQWSARVGYERVLEVGNPESA